MLEFDDSRLDDEAALAGLDDELRELAMAGARVRMASEAARGLSGAGLDIASRPRGLIVLGAEARLVRALLEPVCPVPLVAWQLDTLPGWVGPLDLVVVLASEGSERDLVAATAEAVRRGASLLVAASPASPIAERAASRSTLLLPTPVADPLATVVIALGVLHELGLGPAVDAERVARRADEVATACSPHRDIASNPAKELALALGDATPVVWGGTVLAARAARRVAEALRRASGRPALAADAAALLPVLEASTARDTFADPFDDIGSGPPPVLVVLDDGSDDERVRRERGELVSTAERRGVRVCRLVADDQQPDDLSRYTALLQQGRYAAAYLHLGLLPH